MSVFLAVVGPERSSNALAVFINLARQLANASAFALPVPVGNSRSDILVVQPAQDRQSQRLTDSLDGARHRGVFLQ